MVPSTEETISRAEMFSPRELTPMLEIIQEKTEKTMPRIENKKSLPQLNAN